MIDFASIKKTPCGRDCHYFGKRLGVDSVALHCYGVWSEHGVFEWCYNDAGQRLVFVAGKWVLAERAEPIAPPPKRKVWAYYRHDADSECRSIWLSDLGPEHHDNFDHCQEVEVP